MARNNLVALDVEPREELNVKDATEEGSSFQSRCKLEQKCYELEMKLAQKERDINNNKLLIKKQDRLLHEAHECLKLAREAEIVSPPTWVSMTNY